MADALRLNLDSQRVRLALSLIDAVRAGNSPADVIGARFERLLAKKNEISPGLSQYLLLFREAFPRKPPEAGADSWRDQVPNGVDLVEAWRTRHPSILAPLGQTGTSRQTLEDVLDKLDGLVDATNDLLLFEATFRATRGDRAGATTALDAHSGIGLPGDIHSIETPDTGPGFSHKIILPLRA